MHSSQNLIRFDWAMKRLLRNKASFVVLEGFLSELLGFDIIIDHIPESEGNQQTYDDKLNKIDIVAQTTNNEIILIEVQIAEESDYFHRMLYGVSKAITENIKLGSSYAKVKKVYSINIVYFELGQGKDYVYHGTTDFKGIHQNDILELSEKQKKIFGQENINKIYPEYYVIKVNTFDDLAKDRLDEWIYYFKNNEIPENFKAKGLKEAREVLKADKMTKAEKQAYGKHLENQRYEKSMLNSSFYSGHFEGEKIGIEKGEKIGIYKTVFVALRKGKDIEEIADFTDLPIEVINKLQALLKKYGNQTEEHFNEI